VNRATVTCTTFSCHKQRLVDHVEIEGSVDHRLEAESLSAQILSNATLSYIALGVGAAFAVTAAVFWIIGERPGRYDDFKQIVVPIAFSPLPGGGGLIQTGFSF
jgi:hypothetical protein